jgi:branched-chain amino acid transport system permease protein
MSSARFSLLVALLAAASLLLPSIIGNTYYFYAGYVVLQYVVIGTGWNILGGYAGYINFGASAFFGAGVYTATFIFKAYEAPLLAQILAAAVTGLLLGVVAGYLTLRIQGVYFAIATLALVVVLETFVQNSEYLGGATGLATLAPPPPAWFRDQTQFVFCVMFALASVAVICARLIETSWIGRSLTAIRASEAAAEACGVPTLRMKLLACAISGAIIAMAGAPYPTYAAHVEPPSAFSLTIGLNALAMPLIGGTRSWAGPVIGAVLLASIQQITSITISSEYNILALGLLLIAVVAVAPDGLLGITGKPRIKPASVAGAP